MTEFIAVNVPVERGDKGWRINTFLKMVSEEN